MITIYFRYKSVESFCLSTLPVDPRIPKLSFACLVVGMLSCFGLSVVANFQVYLYLHFSCIKALL